MKIGMIFPGYGSQFVGMCKELYDSSRLIQEYFEEAANCLNSNVVRLCFASSDAELSKIQNAYPAIFLVGSSIAVLLRQEGIEPHVVAGYNTGEYSALFAAKAMNFPDGLYLLSKYAMSYQELLDELKEVELLRATGITADELEAHCKQIRDTGAAVHIALHLSDTEHIISGLAPAPERLKESLDACSGVKIKPASSEVGLHSPLMDPIVGRMTMYLEKVDFHDLAMPLISGSNGGTITAGADVKNTVLAHINNRVMWPQIVAQLDSCDVIIEIGPSDTLQSYIKSCYPDKQVITVNKPEDIEIVKSVCLIKQENPVEPIDEHI
jgi:[acyl-carrier-protein] S-malonyltransferase